MRPASPLALALALAASRVRAQTACAAFPGDAGRLRNAAVDTTTGKFSAP